MASLANVTFEVRLILKILAGLSVVAFLLFMIFKGGVFFKNMFFPEPVPPPDQKFGKLPPIQFPEQNKDSIGFKVNTVDGSIPTFSDRMNVYEITSFEPSLTALQDARNKLFAFQYTTNETKVSETAYRWTRPGGTSITLDIYSNDFTIDSDFLAYPNQFSTGSFSMTKEGLTTYVQSFLSTLGVNVADFQYDITRIRYYTITGSGLTQVESQSDAQIARIDLFQNPVDSTPILYPEYNGSTNHFFIGERNYSLEIVSGQFYHHQVKNDSFGSYPIISTQKALDDLSRGEGIVLTEKPLTSTTFQITDVILSYYLGKEDTGYLIPVYVFSGSDFYALVNAIDPSSITNSSN